MMRDNEQTVDTEIVISIFGVMLLHITLNFKFLNISVFGGLSATLILTRAGSEHQIKLQIFQRCYVSGPKASPTHAQPAIRRRN